MPHGQSYFAALGELLQDIGGGLPRLVVDLERLDDNIEALAALQAPESLRVVAKSLPSAALLEHIFGRLGHERLMIFHLPFLLQLTARFPHSDVLMGKPLPVAAMRRFYRERADNAFDDTNQLQWLVDTEARLLQIVELAREVGRRISVSIELDIGMHRGGIRGMDEFATLLDTIRAHSDLLRLGGFMGYDAHVPKAPWPRSVARAADRSRRHYADFVEFAFSKWSDLEEREWCVNGAGSPTIAMHGASSPLNDFSIGSALVKPTSFDLPTLGAFEPAAWIATPVIKRLAGVRIPFIEKLPSGGRDTLFVYGGKWMARPCWPDGLRENPAYGVSSNQQMLTVPRQSDVAVDDYVFLRPTQSEAVLLQFGDLCIVRGNLHVGNWPALRNDTCPTGDSHPDFVDSHPIPNR